MGYIEALKLAILYFVNFEKVEKDGAWPLPGILKIVEISKKLMITRSTGVTACTTTNGYFFPSP